MKKLISLFLSLCLIPGFNAQVSPSKDLINQSGTLTHIPASCSPGQLYFATDQTPGQNIYGCTATNVWTVNSGGGSGSGFSTKYISPGANSTTTITDNAGLSSPYYRSIFGTAVGTSCEPVQCLSFPVSGMAANSFTVVNTLAGIWAISYAPVTQPTPTFTLSASAASSSVFQNQPGGGATVTLTVSSEGGYAGTVTPSLNSITGITATYSPSTCSSFPCTVTATLSASGSATASNAGTSNALTFSATDGTITQTSGSSLTVWTGPVQQWKMNEGTSPMLDSSGNTNNLTNTNATYTNISGLLSNTLTFNGTSTYSTATNYTNTNFNGFSPFTVCGWFVQSGNRSVEDGIISDMNSSFVGWMLEVRESGASNHIRSWMVNTNGSNWMLVNYNFAPTLNTAFHMCMETDGTEKAAGMTLYANGTASSTAGVDVDALSASIASNSSVLMGIRAVSDTAWLAGGAADVRIFNYGLSAAQVSAIYSAGVK